MCFYRAGDAMGLAHRKQDCQKEETGQGAAEGEGSAAMFNEGEIQLHRPVPPQWRWKGIVRKEPKNPSVFVKK